MQYKTARFSAEILNLSERRRQTKAMVIKVRRPVKRRLSYLHTICLKSLSSASLTQKHSLSLTIFQYPLKTQFLFNLTLSPSPLIRLPLAPETTTISSLLHCNDKCLNENDSLYADVQLHVAYSLYVVCAACPVRTLQLSTLSVFVETPDNNAQNAVKVAQRINKILDLLHLSKVCHISVSGPFVESGSRIAVMSSKVKVFAHA